VNAHEDNSGWKCADIEETSRSLLHCEQGMAIIVIETEIEQNGLTICCEIALKERLQAKYLVVIIMIQN
jgi:hypothetical protein